MASGGSRSGTPGELYPNRGDMAQPKLVSVGQEYGQRQATEESLSKQPLRNNSTSLNQRVPADDMRGMIPSLSDPTARPDEPLTAGLPMGPGPGPEALTGMPAGNQELQILRAVFLRYPNEDLRRLIEFTENSL